MSVAYVSDHSIIPSANLEDTPANPALVKNVPSVPSPARTATAHPIPIPASPAGASATIAGIDCGTF